MNRPFEITERTFEFGVLIVQFCEKLGQRAGARRTLANQLLRAGTSIGANVEEATELSRILGAIVVKARGQDQTA